MVEPLRHRQTKGAETDMPGLPPPRHFPTLPEEMPTLITTVYQSLLALGKPPELEPPTPAVPVRR